MAQIATIFTNESIDQLASYLKPTCNKKMVQAFRASAWVDGGVYGERPRIHFAARFARLVANDARMGDSVAAYAERLATTTRTLNRCLRSAFGRTAGELIQQHVLLASRRLLLQTELSASAIAEQLDFSDASYFSRFFQRHMGMTPGTFRRQRKSASAVANVHCEAARDH